MEIPVIIAVVIGVIYFALVILLHIIREWWQMKNDQIREVNEAERPAIVKPNVYKGKDYEQPLRQRQDFDFNRTIDCHTL
jgi:hypothetical protein